ncbi:glutathione S-transferase family protein [Lichenifustis flavocetrariae]|uniref:Glutathione S-transferase family protein n=1 Tax=Lichenifustis flavocetrariae TaxID=2949735 RepID=A0AA42CJB6_9HYPH|nr:glutathione S-transferase family protein [Lichenifustis flavocetrariae]MCW6507876.1 glutathione S-transferase family protein [Lichenifustis flavocetrariae]
MYRLFIANKNYSSWSLRPWVLMRQRGIPFEEHQVRFGSTDNRALFRSFAPNGTVPCLHDGETAVWDSLGITEYLAERHDGVWPSDPKARAWARCAAAEMHSGFSALRNRCGMNCGLRIALVEMPDDLRRDISRIDEVWSEGLGRFGGPYLAGAAFTAVDSFFAPVAFRIQTFGLQLNGAATAYAERLLALPAMRQWYADALAETFREEGHEREARASGTIVDDLRAAVV